MREKKELSSFGVTGGGLSDSWDEGVKKPLNVARQKRTRHKKTFPAEADM